MSIVYCDKWNNKLCKPRKPITEKTAKKRHENGEPYSAVKYEDDTAVWSVILTGQEYCVVVTYLLPNGKESRKEAYVLADDGRLFMKNTFDKVWGEDHHQAEKVTEFFYQEDGSYVSTMYETQPGDQKRKQTKSEGKVDPTTLYREMPIFGNYDSLFQEPDTFD